MSMPEKKWKFVIVDDADAVAEFLNKNKLDSLSVHIALANQDKFYVFHLG
jgi:hypothetical protein